MKCEYDLYLPTVDQNGQGLDWAGLREIRQGLIDHFGGLTDTRHKNTGFWKMGKVIIRDEIVIWRVMSEDGRLGDDYLRGIKSSLESILKQETILIVKRNIETL